VGRVNFHGPGTYGPVWFNYTGAFPQPLFYGMWFFSMATQKGSRFINTTIVSTNENIKVYGVKDNSDQEIRIVVIHKDINTTQTANITLIFPSDFLTTYRPSGTIIRLLAPNAYATASQITLGGQYFDGSPDGLPKGLPVSEKIEAVKTSTTVEAQFTMKPVGAVLVTFTSSAGKLFPMPLWNHFYMFYLCFNLCLICFNFLRKG